MSLTEENLSRNFKGIWIPREIWLHNELDFFEKMLWAEIDSLDHPEKGCIASNAYLQKFFNVQERTLQRGLSKLKNLGLIRQDSFDGRQRSIKSVLKTSHDKFDTSGVSELSPLGCQNCHPYNKGDKTNKSCSVQEGGVPPSPSIEKRPKSFSKKNSKDEDVKFDESEVFIFSLKSHPDWLTEEIEYALDAAWKCEGPINSMKGFLEGTVKKHRNKKNFEKMEKTKCSTKKESPPKSTSYEEEEKPPVKSSCKPMAQDMLKQLFPGCC